MANHNKKNDTWTADITIKGRRYKKRGFIVKDHALLWEAQTRMQHEKRSVDLDCEDLVQIISVAKKYLENSYTYKKKSAATREKQSIDSFLNFCLQNNISTCNEFAKDTWRKFVQHRSSRVTQRTINIDIQTINRMFSWGIEEQIVYNNPFELAKTFKEKRPDVPEFFTVGEVKKIEEEILKKPFFRCFFPIFFILVRTGMRSGELCTLTEENLDFKNNIITLKSQDTKAGEHRIIPINNEVIDVILKSINKSKSLGCNYIFCSKNGNPLCKINLSKRFKKIVRHCEKEGIIKNSDKYKLHSLRKTYISNLVMAGVDPQKIMSIVGHKEWSTMRRYLYLVPGYANDIINKMPY